MKITRQQQGYVLIEALVGLLIFSLGIIGILALVGTASRSTNDGLWRTEAAMLADELIANMTLSNVANLGTTWCAANSQEVADWWSDRKNNFPSAAAPVVVCDPAAATAANQRDVTITMTWQSPGQPAGTHVTTARIY